MGKGYEMRIKDRNIQDYGDVVTDTQRESWEQTQEKMGAQDARILAAIRESQGLANYELCGIVGRPAHGVSGSLTRLRERGLIEDTGDRKLGPSTARKQIVWRAVVTESDGQRRLF